MLTQDKAKTLTQNIFAHLNSQENLEVLLKSSQTQSTRFADNGITQNVSIHEEKYLLRMQSEGRQARIQVDHLEDSVLPRFLLQLRTLLKMAPKTDPIPLTDVALEPSSSSGFSENTFRNSPEERVSILEQRITPLKKSKSLTSGSYTTKAGSLTYANSLGVFGYYPKTLGSLDVTATSAEEETEGASLGLNQDIQQINSEHIFQESIQLSERAKKAKACDPGYYTVVLHPKATCDLLYFLVELCFPTQNYQEGTSFLSQKLGQKLFSEHLFVEENAFHPELRGFPFDFEGIAKQKRTLIQDGVPLQLVHDRLTAKKAGTVSSGHSLPQPNATGPYPTNIVMKGGTSSMEEMIASTTRGIWVNRFHYTNVVQPMEMILTGMTRAGVFWIENGKISHPINNFRFTINLAEVFRNIEMLGPSQLVDKSIFEQSILAPAMKVSHFHFSSSTAF
ncbi:MAG: TldD/PmbA family protein [Planctomycetota bacterium]